MMRDLSWLLAPLDAARFFERHWEREPLLLHRRRRDYYGALLTVGEFDRVLTTPGLARPQVTVANAEAEIADDDYLVGGSDLDHVQVARLFAEGATITVNGMHRRTEALGIFCRNLEAELSCRAQANVYLSPPRSQGFRRHCDLHDVFVLQLEGTKHWRLYDTPIELPLPEQYAASDGGKASRELELRPGDLAYIPRGVMHDAYTGVKRSLHVTIGLRPYHWRDLIAESLAAAVVRDVDFRRALPPGFARHGFDRGEARRTFRELLARFVSGADADEALDAFVDQFVMTRQPLPREPMALLASLEDFRASTVVAPRAGLVFTLRNEKRHVVLRCHGRESRFPRRAAECLQSALTRGAFAVRELPGSLDAAGKFALVKRLVREGLLERRPIG